MELEFEKYCVVDGSPKTVLPSPRHRSKLEKRKAKGKPRCENNDLLIQKDFTEITFCPYRSASCKDIPSRTIELESNECLKRGSVYQSSKEIRTMKKIGAVERRRKIELPRGSATAFSFGIIDSLCNSDEDSSLVLKSEGNSSVSKPQTEQCSQDILNTSFKPFSQSDYTSDTLLEISLDSDERENQSPEVLERQPIKDSAFTLHKSLSAKLALPHSPSRSESDCSKPSSPKTRFSPIRKMFDPFIKSKSQRSPLGSFAIGISRNKTSQKSLLHDFSNTLSEECEAQFVKKDCLNSSLPSSPVHLQGLLKLENKHGVPFFEFLVKFPEDVFVAKARKVGNALNWVYTFHAVHNRRSNVSGWGLKDAYKELSMVGQMQVSCYLCSELKDAKAFDNSMVTEFILHDIAHARKSVSVQDNSYSFPDTVRSPKVSNEDSNVETYESRHNDLSIIPRPQMELHPNLEVAAIVIKVPFEKRESLKIKRGDSKSDQPLPAFLDLSRVDRREKGITDCPVKVNVVTPCGNHSFPTSETDSPSGLLDRWRLGGGCDCGGWDMGCPLVVFGNHDTKHAENNPLAEENQRPLELFAQGSKEKTPALTMTVSEEGCYTVDFHAQLTTLQAFSICVALLHSTEASIAVGEVREKQLLQCDSLRVFIGQEVKHFIEAVTEEEEKWKAIKKREESAPCFVLNPPFSPIARA